MKLKEAQQNINKKLENYLPRVEREENKIGIEAARYGFLNGGKRLRPILMYSVYQLMSDNICDELIYPYMAAIEMIHSYSLIHDDLPAMDNDELRRGKPTCHIAYGEANGILAGDILLNRAYELIFEHIEKQMESQMSYKKVHCMIRAANVLSHYAGIEGMIGGQVADIASENENNISKDKMLYIHEHKTSALLKSCFEVGCILAGGSIEEQKKFEQIGSDLGLAFQIQDDLLDCNSNQDILGKPIGSDVKNGKTTYISLYGEEKAKEDVEQLFQKIYTAIQSYDMSKESLLFESIVYIQNRKY